MKTPAPIRLIVSLGLFIVALVAPGRATTIDPMLWQQLAEKADLIGVVECVTAGGIVARYRVDEVWKGGARAGDIVAIKIALDYWGPRYPVVLVGQRFMVAAFKNKSPGRMMSTTFGGAVPAWWRSISWDYSLPLFQGSVALDHKAGEGEDSFHNIGSERTRLSEVRADFQNYLALTEAERALTLLRVLVAKYVDREQADGKKIDDFSTTAQPAEVHDKIINALIKIWDDGSGSSRERYSVESVVQQAAGLTRRRVAELARTPQDTSYVLKPGETLYEFATARFGHTAYAYEVFDGNRDVIDALQEPRPGVVLQLYTRRRLMNACLEFRDLRPASPPPPQRPTSAEIAAARDRFARHAPESDGHAAAAELLVAHDPAPIVAWLKTWKAPARDWRDTDRAYVLGSWVAARCGGDRMRFLGELLGADDPHIRVAAAVYLAFEDETKGREALRKLSELPGNPGAWAALTLVRYGERAALRRASEIFSLKHDDLTAGSLLAPLVSARLLEVISNTAAAHNQPTPAWLGGDDLASSIADFFARHPDIRPVDPWLAESRRQKID